MCVCVCVFKTVPGHVCVLYVLCVFYSVSTPINSDLWDRDRSLSGVFFRADLPLPLPSDMRTRGSAGHSGAAPPAASRAHLQRARAPITCVPLSLCARVRR